ncbi:MAG: AmmeMemoRadiSam system protein B [Victivallaceae bacterium]
MEQGTRKTFAAGRFYTNNPEMLSSQISTLIKKSNGIIPAHGARAVILPHAGYEYSALTAMKTLLRASAGDFSRAMVIAPSHRVPFKGIAVSEYEAYSTPVGSVPVDTAAVSDILRQNSQYIQNLSEAHDYEHALEVELPLLRQLNPEIKIIPVIAGFIDIVSAGHVAKALEQFWNKDTLWVISSDFTHFGQAFSYQPFSSDIKKNLHELDMGAVNHILKFDLDGFNHYVNRTGATICGAGPIRILLAATRLAIANGEKLQAELVDYTTSGELTGDFAHCVSYAGISITENK